MLSNTSGTKSTRDKDVETYSIGKYNFTVTSNTPSESAIEAFSIQMNELFEKMYHTAS